ncbi:MAG: hypothetical protein KDK08_02695 [Rhizobiaceae bacterium]|nr:hypothetical protein [Rhizobiaceae bacterium]
MSAPITASHIDWRGVAISIDYRIRRFHGDFDHLEIRVLGDGIIPITETGYRSHFLPHGIVEEFGGPDEYVTAWLDHEAESAEWKKREAAARQLSLF